MGGSGRGGSNHGNRRHFSRRRERDGDPAHQENTKGEKRASESLTGGEARIEKGRGGLYERPRWVPPVLPSESIPVPDCPWCGKPIKDISTGIADKQSGEPVHFDCVIARLTEEEPLERGDAVCYIGGGRFGVIHYNNPPDMRDFTIKKIVEWEDKDNRSEWRRSISGHFSVT